MRERLITKDLIRSFEEYMHEEERSNATIEKYNRDIKHFVVFADGKQITKEVTLAYKERLSKEYALTSANSMIAALNTFLKFAGWDDCKVKFFKVQKKTYCTESEELTRKEYERLVSVAEKNGKKRISLILQTICSTGIRVSELEYITVESLKKGKAVVDCKGKQRMVLLIPALTKKLFKYIYRNKIISGPIFVTRTGKPISRCNIWREMKQLCKEANVSREKVFPHNLRHLFARVFYEIEKDIAKLADILGHSNIDTTRIYVMTTGVEHREKMARLKLIL